MSQKEKNDMEEVYINLHFTVIVTSLQDAGALYSLGVPYFNFLAFLQLVAIFVPSVGGGGVSRGLALHCELASLVH